MYPSSLHADRDDLRNLSATRHAQGRSQAVELERDPATHLPREVVAQLEALTN